MNMNMPMLRWQEKTLPMPDWRTVSDDAGRLMEKMIEDKVEPFDMIFIDADKPNNPRYLELSLQLSKKGTVIYGDNIIRDGHLADEDSSDPKVQGIRTYMQNIGRLPDVSTTGIQTVGCKGYDGFSLSIVEEV